MKILVTGGAGFIGSHVVDLYLKAGHEVTVLDNLSTGNRRNLNSAAAFVEADVRDRNSMLEIVDAGRFDVVNHHAAQLDVRISVRDPQLDAEQNIIGSLNMLEAARAAGTRAVIFASSGGTVYGEGEMLPSEEDHPTNPVSPYGITKLAVEKYLGFYRREYGIRHVVLRYANVYGPRQNVHGESGVVAIFCDRMAAGQQPVINGSGLQTRDYVYVSDVARANLLALDHVARGESGTYNVSSGQETTVNEIFGLLATRFGCPIVESHGPAKPGEQLRSVCSPARAKRELGWEPLTDLATGLDNTVAYYRA